MTPEQRQHLRDARNRIAKLVWLFRSEAEFDITEDDAKAIEALLDETDRLQRVVDGLTGIIRAGGLPGIEQLEAVL